MKTLSRSFLLMVCMGLAPAGAQAQTDDPVAAAKLRVGPFGITPGISVSSGTDSNVFAEEVNPKSDFMTAVSPHAQLWLRARRLILDAQNFTNIVNYRQYDSQGGFSTRNEVRLAIPVNRVRFIVGNNFMTTDERASFEIDARVRRHEISLTGGADIRATSKTFVRLTAARMSTKFDEDATNLGVDLSESLNRRTSIATAAWRYQVTGATTFSMSADAAREEFEFSPEKDSRSIRISPGVEFDSRAIISGRAHVGYRRFEIISGLAPDFSGPVADVELSSTLRETTRLRVQANRDVAYSFEVATPYYVLVGGGVSIGQRLGQRWEITAQASRQNMRYEAAAPIPQSTAPVSGDPLVPAPAATSPSTVKRTDRFDTFGAGVHYLFSDTIRFGVGIDRSQRRSGLTLRGYESTRVVAQFGYGP